MSVPVITGVTYQSGTIAVPVNGGVPVETVITVSGTGFDAAGNDLGSD